MIRLMMCLNKTLWVCLIEWISQRMERKWEKIKRESFFKGVELEEGEKKKKRSGSSVFSLNLSKSFLPKIRRKLRGEKTQCELTKMPICIVHMCPVLTFSFFFFFFFFFYSFFFNFEASIQNVFNKKKSYFFVLFNEDIIVYLYQLDFSSSHFSF